MTQAATARHNMASMAAAGLGPSQVTELYSSNDYDNNIHDTFSLHTRWTLATLLRVAAAATLPDLLVGASNK